MLSPFAGPEVPAKPFVNQQSVAKKPEFAKKENAILEQRIEILNWHHANGENQTKTAVHFDAIYLNLWLKQPRISAWCKHEETWRAEYKTGIGSTYLAKQVRQTQHAEVTEMLDLWVSKAMADQLLLTGEVLHQKWKKFADLVSVPEDKQLNLSEGWLIQYKMRTGLKEMKHHDEAASATPETVDKEWVQVQEIIKKLGYKQHNIFNADEIASFYA